MNGKHLGLIASGLLASLAAQAEASIVQVKKSSIVQEDFVFALRSEFTVQESFEVDEKLNSLRQDLAVSEELREELSDNPYNVLDRYDFSDKFKDTVINKGILDQLGSKDWCLSTSCGNTGCGGTGCGGTGCGSTGCGSTKKFEMNPEITALINPADKLKGPSVFLPGRIGR